MKLNEEQRKKLCESLMKEARVCQDRGDIKEFRKIFKTFLELNFAEDIQTVLHGAELERLLVLKKFLEWQHDKDQHIELIAKQMLEYFYDKGVKDLKFKIEEVK
tara:strand:- start:7 stop:318 length:312 start_codon:yes stop_codon:yes gene_type:complete